LTLHREGTHFHLLSLHWLEPKRTAQLAGSTANHCQQGGHHFIKCPALGKTSTDETSKSPQTLSLGDPTPKRHAAIEIKLDLTLKLVQESIVMWGGSQ